MEFARIPGAQGISGEIHYPKIKSCQSTSGKVLDVAEVNYSNGGTLHLWDWVHAPNQVWSLEAVETP